MILIIALIQHKIGINAGFTYRFDRLKPRASKFGGPPVKVYDILTLLLDYHTYMLSYISEADLEGACGACAPHPPPKIRKAYVIQR